MRKNCRQNDRAVFGTQNEVGLETIFRSIGEDVRANCPGKEFFWHRDLINCVVWSSLGNLRGKVCSAVTSKSVAIDRSRNPSVLKRGLGWLFF